MRQEINGWFVSGPISGETKCSKKFVIIDSNLVLIPY